MTQNKTDNFDQHYADQQIKRSQSGFRRVIKYFYLKNILQYVDGPTIDFGCGAGQLLAKLPPKSLGLELNEYLIKSLRSQGLEVQQYIPEEDRYQLIGIAEDVYKTLVLSHVLEHFKNPEEMLGELLPSLRRLGVNKIIICVPGLIGYQSDSTHKTFIDLKFMQKLSVFSANGFQLKKHAYFPINSAIAGNYFIYNELNLIYESI